MDINLSPNSSVASDNKTQLARSSPSPHRSRGSEPSPFDKETISPVSPTRKRSRLEAGLDVEAAHHSSDQTALIDEHDWDLVIHDITSDDHHCTESSEDLEKEALMRDDLFEGWDDVETSPQWQAASPAPSATQELQRATTQDPLSEVFLETWKALEQDASLSHKEAIQGALTTLIEGRTEAEDDTVRDNAYATEAAPQGQAASPAPPASQQLQRATTQDPLSQATSEVLKALQHNASLSHQAAMEVALATLIKGRMGSRIIEAQAFKIVARVFHNALYGNSSTSASDYAHLQKQDQLYDADVQQGIEAHLSEEKAYEAAIVRAGQRSFYFDPTYNAKEAKNQAQRGMQAAHDYFVLQKKIPSSLLPSIEELLPSVTTSSVIGR